MALHESCQIFLTFIDTILILKLPISKMSSKFHSLEKFSSLLYTENVDKMNQKFQGKSFDALVKLPRTFCFLAYWLEHILMHSSNRINSYCFYHCYNAILQKMQPVAELICKINSCFYKCVILHSLKSRIGRKLSTIKLMLQFQNVHCCRENHPKHVLFKAVFSCIHHNIGSNNI